MLVYGDLIISEGGEAEVEGEVTVQCFVVDGCGWERTLTTNG